MHLMTRSNEDIETFMHPKMGGTSFPGQVHNETLPNVDNWRQCLGSIKVEITDETPQSTTLPMRYRDESQQGSSTSRFDVGPAQSQFDASPSLIQYYFANNNPLTSVADSYNIPADMERIHVSSAHGHLLPGNSTQQSSIDSEVINRETTYSMKIETRNVALARCTPSDDQSANIFALREQRPRIQPHVLPKPSDIVINMKDFPPPAPIPDAWCHAYYYELNQRIGEPFKGGRSHVIVDGFCAPSEAERFCLGAIANVNRSPAVIAARRQIGRGVLLYRQNEDVYVECLSEAPVFIQSPIHAVKASDHPATVYRLPSGHVMQIFDNEAFEALLEKSASQGYNSVYALQRMCHMRISFVKGWGEQYKRQTITSTPCWVEIHFPIPLQKLDRVLSQIPGPDDAIHSFT